MNILVFTPLYCVGDRKDLVQDTSAIHYLVKYWSSNNNVLVINTYLNYRSNIKRYLSKKNRNYYKEDYSFIKDNIKVYIIENQILTTGGFMECNWKHCAKHTKNILEKEKFLPDIVISHFPSYSYGFIDRLDIKVPKIAVLHQTDVINYQKSKKFQQALDKKYTAVFCRSKKIFNYFDSMGLANLKKDIIYSGAPQSYSRSLRNWEDFDKREIKILYVGKLIPRKHIDWILRSLEKQRNRAFHLTIIGKGPEEENIKTLVEKLNLSNSVSFIESIPREEVLKEMGKADIFCMPSSNETFGLVYIEALSKGCLTVALKKEGIDGVIIDSINGFLVEDEKDFQSCIDKIFYRLSNKEIKVISQEAIRTGVNFSEENVAERYLTIVRNILNKR